MVWRHITAAWLESTLLARAPALHMLARGRAWQKGSSAPAGLGLMPGYGLYAAQPGFERFSAPAHFHVPEVRCAVQARGALTTKPAHHALYFTTKQDIFDALQSALRAFVAVWLRKVLRMCLGFERLDSFGCFFCVLSSRVVASCEVPITRAAQGVVTSRGLCPYAHNEYSFVLV